ncbi:YicC/YloC family endoribonuclease [Oceanospirillum linum]|uniref:YicC family protein n=1 Tax=Oceanospirillum linum TaxID=966 RepID=A0A1T1HBZ5_OCELI|nr:YicC/YloC family endoribonuclease [Oceanospirillum linum]OOV87316.1 YicC family protein [Oceanospirillum linum]SEF81239.1 TIGR00255 family protein [Oleiphilus messinensis]SMP19036.1 TIGR00255 family protein [Oceanospirillum linum]
MTHSMTAFTRQEEQHPWGTLSWEIRSVNQRFLEPHFRLPDTLRELEPAIRDLQRKSLNRGKVESVLRFHPTQVSDSLNIDEQLVKQLASAAETISGHLSKPGSINPLQIMQWPGVLQNEEVDADQLKKAALDLYKKGLQDLIAMRAREGEELASLINQRLDGIDAIVVQVRAALPGILERQRQLILDKLDSIKDDLDPARLEQEMVLIANKTDVAEELDRLDTHVKEVRRTLKKKDPVGRRLDFLMQELNREANTLSSKSIVTETTQCAVELKVLIEQMREQIQNIE